jgi:hypothetical protein
MKDEIATLKGKKKTMAIQMRDAAIDKNKEIFDDLGNNGCFGTSACPGTGFDSVEDKPNGTGG